jgi:magnesium-transporting ATPase (P-type)
MNFCAVGVTMICPFLGYESPVTVVQMLWINMIMDTLGGLAFAGEAALPEYMKEPPKRRDEPILNGYMINQIGFLGAFTVGLCILFLKSPHITAVYRTAPNDIYLLTAFFALFIFFENASLPISKIFFPLIFAVTAADKPAGPVPIIAMSARSIPFTSVYYIIYYIL